MFLFFGNLRISRLIAHAELILDLDPQLSDSFYGNRLAIVIVAVDGEQ
jgi:hypothetical protein